VFLAFALIAVGLAFIDGHLPRALPVAKPNPVARILRLPTGQKSR
jgi:hypothetical protein